MVALDEDNYKEAIEASVKVFVSRGIRQHSLKIQASTLAALHGALPPSLYPSICDTALILQIEASKVSAFFPFSLLPLGFPFFSSTATTGFVVVCDCGFVVAKAVADDIVCAGRCRC